MKKQELKGKVEEIMGLDDIFLRTRKDEYYQGRVLYFGYRKYIEGYTYSRIAEEFYKGCNHSVVSRAINRSFDILTSTILKDAWNELTSGSSKADTEVYMLKKENKRLRKIVDKVSVNMEELDRLGLLDEVLVKFNHITEATLLMNKL